MTNPLKSQIAANRERFEKEFVNLMSIRIPKEKVAGGYRLDERTPEVKDFLTTSQTSLLQTVIAAVEMFDTGAYHNEDYVKGFYAFQEKVVELLKGGITD